MTTYNIKSTLITNRDATPKVLTDALVAGGDVKSAFGYVQTNGAADGVGSIYRFCSVPSSARVDSLVIQNGALGSGCTLDVGVYWPTFIPAGAGLDQANASLVITAAFFASAVDCSAAAQDTNIINESGTNTIAKQEQPLWQALGLASDPGIELDVCATVFGAVATQGYIGLKCRYAE